MKSRVAVTVRVEFERDPDKREGYSYPGSRVLNAVTPDEIVIAMVQEDVEGVVEGMCSFEEISPLDFTFVGAEVIQ